MLRFARYTTLVLVVLATAVLGLTWQAGWISGGWPAGGAALCALGLHDLLQTRHAVLRNYPIIGHLRFLFETIRPEMRQYFFESDTESVPFSRQQRAIVYQRAKRELDVRPFGSHLDPYADG